MEVSVVRRRVSEAVERAKRAAAERRQRSDVATREYAAFLDGVAVPLMRQVANVLKTQGYPFTVNTPGGSVRLVSEKRAEDFIELTLDTTGRAPVVIGRSSHVRGRRVIESERPVAPESTAAISDEQLLAFLLDELEPMLG